MSELITYRLDEIADVIDCEHKTAPKVDSSEYYSIRTPDIKNGRLLYEQANRVSAETYAAWTKRGVPEAGDIILAREAPVGEVGWIDKDHKICLGQRTVLIKIHSTEIDKKYLLYSFVSPKFKDYLNELSGGSVVAHLNMKDIRALEFAFPPLPEQKAIASVLSSLDDKIDLLHRQNKTLEAMAETLFRQWFIEEAKEDWEEVSLGSLFTISSGKGLKRDQFSDHGLIPVLGANGVIGRTDQAMFEEFLIYTGRVGTLGKVSIIEGQPVWLSDNTLVFRDIEYFYFTYFHLKAVNYQDYNVGSTQPLIRQSDIKEIAVLLPSDLSIIKRFEFQAKDLFGKIQTNRKQIQTLENLRDTLLPKLMSGEVRVQYQTEEVA